VICQVFWRGFVLIVVYTVDTIVTGPDAKAFNKAMEDIGMCFDIATSDSFNTFIGVKVVKDEEMGKLLFAQPQFIDSILDDLNLDD
jgi:hypothetical protein